MISEDKIDVVLGSTISPNSLAMIDVVAEAGVLMISMAASSRIVEPSGRQAPLVFKTPQNDAQMSTRDRRAHDQRGCEDGCLHRFCRRPRRRLVAAVLGDCRSRKLKVVGNERYNRADTSVTGQVLKIVSARPDAVLIAGRHARRCAAAEGVKERGFSGKIYQTHGVANNDFLRVCGRTAKAPSCPRVRCWWSTSCPTATRSRTAMTYITRATRRRTARAAFSIWRPRLGIPACCCRLRCRWRSRPEKPGTAEFRAALRDALEGSKEVACPRHLLNMSPADHLGLDQKLG